MDEIIPLLYEGGYRDLDLNFCEMMNPVSLLKDRRSAGPYIEELRRMKEEFGLDYHQCHLPYTPDYLSLSPEKKEEHLRDIELALTYSEELGIRNAVIHPIRGSEEANLEYFHEVLKVKPESIRLAIENMEREDEIYKAEDLIKLAETLGSETGICLDTGHAHIMGQDIAAFIELCGDMLIATHIADNNGKEDQHLIPGYGTIEWEKVIPAFRKHYSGFLNYEAMFHGRNLPEEAYKETIRKSIDAGKWLLSL